MFACGHAPIRPSITAGTTFSILTHSSVTGSLQTFPAIFDLLDGLEDSCSVHFKHLFKQLVLLSLSAMEAFSNPLKI